MYHHLQGNHTNVIIGLPKEDVYFVDVAGVQSDWMIGLCVNILKGEKVVWHLWWSCHLTSSL